MLLPSAFSTTDLAVSKQEKRGHTELALPKKAWGATVNSGVLRGTVSAKPNHGWAQQEV